MTNLLYVFLMAPAQNGQSPLMSLLPLLLIVVVFYFFMIRPQMKKQKEMRNFRQSLKVGDKVITSGGIYGKVAELRETTIILEVENNVRFKVDIASVFRDSTDIETKK